MLRMFFFLRVVSDLQSDSINAVASVLLCCGLKIVILLSVGLQIRRNRQENPTRRGIENQPRRVIFSLFVVFLTHKMILRFFLYWQYLH